MKGTVRLVLMCLLFGLTAGCIGWSSSAADRRRDVDVDEGPSIGSVQLYSGRMSPAWELSEPVRLQLVQAMAQLRPSPDDEQYSPEELGFRSVDVSNLDTTEGWASLARLQKGRIVIELAGGTTFILLDPSSTGLRAVLPEIDRQVDPTVGQVIAEVLAT